MLQGAGSRECRVGIATDVGHQVQDIDESAAIRLRVLRAIFEQTGHDTEQAVDLAPLRGMLGLNDDDMADAIDYLEAEHLIKPMRTVHGERTPERAHITHRGVHEIGQFIKAPHHATAHLPSQDAVLMHATMAVHNDVHAAEGELGEAADQVRDFVKELVARLPELKDELPEEELAKIAEHARAVHEHVNSPEPRHHYIRECLNAVEAILESGVGGAVTTALLALATQIRF
jgi:hypothetical protein